MTVRGVFISQVSGRESTVGQRGLADLIAGLDLEPREPAKNRFA